MGANCCTQGCFGRRPKTIQNVEAGVQYDLIQPEDDTISRLTAKLVDMETLVTEMQTEKQKLASEKESLEHAVNNTAAHRDQLKESIQALELQLSNKANEYSVKISNLQVTIKDLQGKLQSANTTAQDEIEKISREKASLEGSVAAAERQSVQVREKLHELELKFSSKENECSDQISSLEATVGDLQEKLQSANTSLTESQKEIAKRDMQIDDLVRTVADLQYRLDQSLDQNKELDHTKLKLSSQEKEYSSQISSLEANVKDLQEKLQVASISLTTSSEEIAKRDSQIDDLVTKIADLQDRLVQSRDLKQELDNTKAEKPVLQQRILDLEQQTEDLQNKLNESQANATRAQQLAGTLRVQLQSSRSAMEKEREEKDKIAREKESIGTELANSQDTIQELLLKIEDGNQHQETLQSSSASTSSPNNGPIRKVYICSLCKKFEHESIQHINEHTKLCFQFGGHFVDNGFGFGLRM